MGSATSGIYATDADASSQVKMWYQDAQGRYQEVTNELEGYASLEDLFSHASISCSKGMPPSYPPILSSKDEGST